MKHKVGDKVRIKSLDWYKTNKKNGKVVSEIGGAAFICLMSKYCSKMATIIDICDNRYYKLDIDDEYFNWEDYMFEDYFCNYAYRATSNIEHNKRILKYLQALGGKNKYDYEGDIGCNYCYYLNDSGFIDADTLDNLKNMGYTIIEFKDKEQNTMKERTIKISLETAKEWYKKGGELKEVALQAYKEEELTELPKTWEKCIMQLGKGEYVSTDSYIYESVNLDNLASLSTCYNVLPCGLGKPMLALCQLLVCREIYRQGWEPNWSNGSFKYAIYYSKDKIYAVRNIDAKRILTFQSAEIRDKFLENFRDLIEEAKELI